MFNYRFNHQINVTEITVVQCWGDLVQYACHFHGIHTTAGYTFVQQFSGFIQTQLQGTLVNILHQDWRAFNRGLIRNTAAHNTGTQYGSLGNRFCLFLKAFADFFHILIFKEQAHQ